MRGIQSVSRLLPLLLAALLAQGVLAADNQTYTVKLPSDAATTRSIPSAGTGVVLPSSYGQWGFTKATVEPEVPAGNVVLKVRYYADPDCTALTLLYVEDSTGEALPIYGLRIAAGSDKAVHEASFPVNSPKGVRALVIKRGDAVDVPTVPILSIELTHQPSMPDPRVRAYKELLARPAPAGADRGLARKWIGEADSAALAGDTKTSGELYAKVEGWLAAESHLAWLDDTVEYLCSAALAGSDAYALVDTLKQARLSLNTGDTQKAESTLGPMDREIDRLDHEIGWGVSVLPQKQPVITTWNRNWTLAGFAEEPTPLAVKWQGGVTLRLTDETVPDTIVPGGVSVRSRGEYASGFTVRRSWTGNIWEGPDFTLTTTVLTPLVMIDRVSRKLTFTITGLDSPKITFREQLTGKPSSRRWLVGSPSGKANLHQVVIISGGKYAIIVIPPAKGLLIHRDDLGTSLTCDKGARFSFLAVPSDALSSAVVGEKGVEAAIRFWSGVAANPPVECVQRYANSELTLRYFYDRRQQTKFVNPVRVAPVPPLAVLAQNSGWKLGMGKLQSAPAAWPNGKLAYAKEASHLVLTVPPMKSPGLRGINIGIAAADEKVYRELAELGATSIRLLVKEDEVDTKLAQHLEWCKKAGLKATVDQHYGAYYDPTPDHQAKLIALWERIARVCLPVRDAVKAYDFKNEPMEDAKVYLPWAQKCVDAIRKIDPVTPILVEAPQMANPTGFIGLQPLKGANLIYGVHVYVPHGFTHGRIYGSPLFGSPDASPARFYPGWITPIDWSKSSETWFNGGFEWWDRWELAASCLPVTEFLIRNRLPLDVGEFGVVGYLMRDGTIPTSQMWLKDAIDLFENWGASWDVWSYEHGYTWYPGGKELVAEKWRELNRK